MNQTNNKMNGNKDKRKGLVGLLKYVGNNWRVVDYGVPLKVSVYIALGYVVKRF